MRREFIIEHIDEYVGDEVILKGWVYNRRSSGKIVFLLVRDGTGIVQVVFTPRDSGEENFKIAESLSQETSLEIKGIVREEKRAPGGYEIIGKEIRPIHHSEGYPITKKSHGVDFLLRHRHLWLRSRKQFAILRIRSELVKAIRDYLDERDFVLIDSPIFTPTSCEGTTTLFEVPYFDDKVVYLSQSGQLYQEAGAAAFRRVYCFGPVFRAEKSKTRRHLTEFWQVEPEVAFMEFDALLEFAEDFISYIVQRVLEKRKKELEILERDTSLLEKVSPPFPRITYMDAVKLLQEKGMDIKEGDDFGADEETEISKSFEKPVMVHRFLAEMKPFYMKRDPENNKLALAVDILAPEGYGEILGGSQREDDYDTLLKRMKEDNLPIEHFQWYLDLRKYGSFPHSGFGLGIERTVAWISGIHHVREAIPFPRTIDRVYP